MPNNRLLFVTADSILAKFIVCFFIAMLALPVSAAPESTLQPTAVHAVAMHGKVKYPPDFQHFDYLSPDAVKGGEIKLGMQGTFDSLNPYIAKGSAADHLGLIYDTLTVASADEAFSRYGLIAESIVMPEDRSWVIYNLRKNARFHDGQPITAADVVFTFHLLIEKGSPLFRSYYQGVKSVSALSPQAVKFEFADTENRELPLTIGELPVLPKHYWQSRDFERSSLEPPLGSGPYKVRSVDPGRSMVFERVDDYWAKDLPVNRGLYNFDMIQVDYYKDAVVLLEALKAGLYDIRVENISKQWATGYSGEALDKGLLVKQEIPHENPTGMQAFILNLRNPLFRDIRVRQALTYAFDFEWTNKNLFYDLYARTLSYFSNSELASHGPLTGRELEILAPYKNQLPAALFEHPFSLPISDGSGHNRNNLRQAVKLLKSAGWQVVNNQLIHQKTGQIFEFEMLSYDPSTERIVNPYAKALEKLGIKLNVRQVDISQYINRLRQFQFDMITGGFGQSLSPGNEQIDYWHSSSAQHEGSRNLAGIQNPVVDELVGQIIAAPDRQELINRTRALDRVLLFNYFTIPQWHSDRHRVAYWNKFSRPAIAPKYDYNFDFNLLSRWIDNEKLQALEKARKALN